MLGVRRDDLHRNHIGSRHPLGFTLMVRGDGIEICPRNFHRLRCRNFVLRFRSEAFFQIAQYGETGLCVVEHVPGFAAPGFDGLHVVFDADDGIGQPIGFLLRQSGRAAAAQGQGNQVADAVHNIHSPRLVEHHQAGLDAAYQRRNAVESLRGAVGPEALTECLLDARKVDNAFPHYRLRDFLVVRIFEIWQRGFVAGHYRLRRYNQPNQLLIKTIFYTQ